MSKNEHDHDEANGAACPSCRRKITMGTSWGVVVGGAAGAVIAQLLSEQNVKMLDWLTAHGATGVALFVAVALAAVTWRLLHERSRLEKRYADKVEVLLREQIGLAKRTVALHTETVEVLRAFGREVEFEDDGDENPSPDQGECHGG